MHQSRFFYPVALLFLMIVSSLTSAADDPFAKVTIKTIKVTDNIYMLVGEGGNIGVFEGADGLLMIDDQFAPLAPKITAALAKLGNSAPTYLLNTHFHGDHTGGNAHFGAESIVLAHQNVRLRLIKEGEMPKAGLPVITYDSKAHLFFNGESIDIIHTPHGHTDGDSLVYFTQSNVIHMGDNLFNRSFPFIDINAGGSLKGMIAAAKMVLEITNSDTKIIPGHGSLANRADLIAYLGMLRETRDSVKQSLNTGLTEEQIIAKGLDKKWQGWGHGFINEKRWIQTLVKSLQPGV